MLRWRESAATLGKPLHDRGVTFQYLEETACLVKKHTRDRQRRIIGPGVFQDGGEFGRREKPGGLARVDQVDKAGHETRLRALHP